MSRVEPQNLLVGSAGVSPASREQKTKLAGETPALPGIKSKLLLLHTFQLLVRQGRALVEVEVLDVFQTE